MKFDITANIHLHVHSSTDVPWWAKNLRDIIDRNMEATMATLQDVKDEISATKQEVADTRGVIHSEVTAEKQDLAAAVARGPA